MSKDKATAAVAAAGSPGDLERDIEETRARLAATIDELVHRVSPKTIASREVASVRGFFVDTTTGQPRTENVLKVVGSVLGVVVLFVVVRKVTH